jgi:hypothetical protein
MPTNPPSQIYAIGQGIVGSEAEESMRQTVAWKEGGVYLVPSNGGKAVGWVHKVVADKMTKESSSTSPAGAATATDTTTITTSNDSHEEINSQVEVTIGGGPIELLIAKVPVDLIKSSDDCEKNPVDEDCWTTSVLLLIQKYVQQTAVKDEFVTLTDDDAGVFCDAMIQLVTK